MKYCYDVETNKQFVVLRENKREYLLENEERNRYIIRKTIFDKWFVMYPCN